MCPCVEVHKRTSLISPSLFLLCSEFLVSHTWIYWRLEVSGRTNAVSWGAAFGIFSKRHAAFLGSSHLALSPGVLWESGMWINTVVPTRPQLWRNLVFFVPRDQIFIRSTVFWYHFQLMRYCRRGIMNKSTDLKGFPLIVVVAPCLKHMSCFYVFMWRTIPPAAGFLLYIYIYR